MAVKRKTKGVVPPKHVGPVKAPKPKPVSKHAGTRFISGELGRELADANDEVVEALKEMGFKPTKKPVSAEPFTADQNKRRWLAGFVEKPEHRPITMPGKDFVSQLGGPKVESKGMDAETKAYLKEKSAAKRMLLPKRAAGGVSIQDLCKELNIEPGDARKALRKAKVQKPDCGWFWSTREEAETVLRTAGLMKTPTKKPTPVEQKVAIKKVVKEAAKAIKKAATSSKKGRS